MMTFEELVVRHLPTADPGIDSVLDAFLPLLRQVIETHQANAVAPLEGIQRLQFADGRVSFADVDRKPIRSAENELRRVETTVSAALEVTGVTRRVSESVEGERKIRADIGVPAFP